MWSNLYGYGGTTSVVCVCVCVHALWAVLSHLSYDTIVIVGITYVTGVPVVYVCVCVCVCVCAVSHLSYDDTIAIVGIT